MTITKTIINEIENALHEVEEQYNEAYANRDEAETNNVYQRFKGMMQIIRLFGYDMCYEDGEDFIMRIKKI